MERDFERIIQLIARELIDGQNAWMSFRQLAHRIGGDATDDDLIAAAVCSRPDWFTVHQDRRTKIRSEAFQAVREFAGDRAPREPHLAAAEAVREYARQLFPTRVPVVGVDAGRAVLERYLHAVQVDITDDDLKLPDDTPVELVSDNGTRNAGHIVGASRDEAVLFVSFRAEVLPIDLPAWLEVSRSKPVLDIAERLAALEQTPPLALRLASPGAGAPIASDDSRIVGRQLAALETPWVRLLWGPPGAGKTFCVAQIATELMRSAPTERLLMVAPSNVAADAVVGELVALEADSNGATLLRERRVMRFGYPRDERVLARPELLGPKDVEELSSQILAAHQELQHLTRSRAPDGIRAEAKARLQQLEQERKERVASHLLEARIVATTITSALMGSSPIITAGPWSTVVADEASMINAATVLVLAELAKSRLLLVGDPRQLAPILDWRRRTTPPRAVEDWIGKDPFETAGLAVGSGWGKTIKDEDARLARVLSQRRCHPTIWSLVARLYPTVRANVDMPRLAGTISGPPAPGEPAVVLDLSQARSAAPAPDADADSVALQFDCACRKVGGTWENPPSAQIAIDVAREIRAHSKDAKIAIVTPYRGQVRLIRRWLDGEHKADPRLTGIEVGTVHAFQGGEADAVIFDVVDGPPRSGLGALLRDDAGMRLVNVAVTRARAKLVVIAHREWLKSADRAREGLLWSVLFGPSVQPRVCSVVAPPAIDRAAPESPIEEILLAEIQKRQADLPPCVLQHRILNEAGRIVSRADMAFIDAILAVFCDGARYHLKSTQWQRDIRQRRELTRLGWRVLVFSGAEITASAAACVDEIIRSVGGQPAPKSNVDPEGRVVSEPPQAHAPKVVPVVKRAGERPAPADGAWLLEELMSLDPGLEAGSCPKCSRAARLEVGEEGVVHRCGVSECGTLVRVDVQTLQRLADRVGATCYHCKGNKLRSERRPYANILVCQSCGSNNRWQLLNQRLDPWKRSADVVTRNESSQ